jgi:hypothetical protein
VGCSIVKSDARSGSTPGAAVEEEQRFSAARRLGHRRLPAIVRAAERAQS